MPDNSSKIDAANQLLEAGVQSVSFDGVTVNVDAERAASERQRLERADDVAKTKRPRISSWDLRGAF